MDTHFTKLNEDWNADPNAPMPATAQEGDDLWLRFRPNEWLNPSHLAQGHLFMRFVGCQRFRFTLINDHGWYGGQCRFSKLAPAWGEFYEVDGDFLEGGDTTPWNSVSAGADSASNFLFYFRDEAFECTALSWSLSTECSSGLTFKGTICHV
ncbi:hypothetical protein [Ruegeria arenilitoris]|uniref:hypothetical protein n=1 Tax=Ruegeria arenilitoris TaxID=1173585 RepID=UPI00147C2422|nr:hypothetical protein [Ruegeria arenilitoris]